MAVALRALTTTTDLEQLKGKLAQVEGLVTPPESEEQRRGVRGKASRAERRLRWYRGVEDAVLDLSGAMPQGVEDYDVRKLLEFIVELRRLLETDPDVRDANGEIELATMRMADAVRRIHTRLQRAHLDDPHEAATYVFDVLGVLPAAELARMLGVSTRTIHSWQQGNAVRQNASRVALVAQLTADLIGSMTPRGVALWFDAERPQLDGRTPLEVLEADDKQGQLMLIELSQGLHGQLAG